MLEALEEMHRNGLLHRDVKPANFAVSPAGYMMSSGENFEGMLPDFLPTQAALGLFTPYMPIQVMAPVRFAVMVYKCMQLASAWVGSLHVTQLPS